MKQDFWYFPETYFILQLIKKIKKELNNKAPQAIWKLCFPQLKSQEEQSSLQAAKSYKNVIFLQKNLKLCSKNAESSRQFCTMRNSYQSGRDALSEQSILQESKWKKLSELKKSDSRPLKL